MATNINHKLQLPFFVLIVLVPIIFTPRLTAAIFTSPKLFLVRLVIVFLLAVISLNLASHHQLKFRPSVFNKLLAALGISAVLSTITSSNIYTSLLGIDGRFIGLFTILGFYLLTFLTFQIFRHPQQIKTLLKVSLITATILAIYGILQSQVWFNDFTNTLFQWRFSPLQRTFATFGHSTHFAAYLAMHLPLAVYFYRQGLKKSLGALVLIAWALLTTGSRGAFLALIIVGIVAGLVNLAQKFHFKKTFYYKALFAILSILIIIFSWVFSSFTPNQNPIPAPDETQQTTGLATFNRTQSLFQNLQNGIIPDRISWWFSSIDIWLESPIFGSGLATFADSYNQHRRLDYRVPADEQDYILPHYAHMHFLNILATEGLVGFLIFGAFLYFLYQKSFQNFTDPLIKTLLASISIFLVFLLTNFWVVSTLTIFSIFIGLLIALITPSKTLTIKVRKPLPMVLVSVFILIFSGFLTVRQITADIWKYQAQSAPLPLQKFYYQKAINLNPYEYHYYLLLGDSLLKSGRQGIDISVIQTTLKQAISVYDQAKKINDSHPIIDNHLAKVYSELAIVALNNDDQPNFNQYFALAEKSHQAAIAKGPNNPIYPYDLGLFYLQFKKSEQAQQAFLATQKIRPNFRRLNEFLAAPN